MRKRDRPLTAQSSKDENQANILCDIYWEAPWDPNVCRRKLLNVQKLREKQHSTRRGFTGRNATPRPSSASGHDGVLDESPRGVGRSPPKHAAQHGLGSIIANQGLAARMSASFTENASGNNSSLVGTGTDAPSVVSGPQLYTSGPLSYTNAGYPSGFMNSFNEVDFASALQRPGVVPMGESVSSSVDMGGLSSYQQQQIFGSLGGNNRNLVRATQGAMASRSYGGMGEIPQDRNSLGFAPGSVGTTPSGMGQQRSSSMQLGSSLGQQPHGMFNQQLSASFGQELHFGNAGAGVPSNLLSQQSGMTQAMDDQIMQAQMHQMQMQMQQDPTTIANTLQQHLVYGNAQAYLQQQHAALQQQQLLLQQQQAALALQQQQLQVYGLNPGMVNGAPAAYNQNAGQHAAMNQFGQADGGYYYVTSADGTPMMVSAASVGQAGAYGLPQQASSYGGASIDSHGQQGVYDPRFYQQQDPNQY